MQDFRSIEDMRPYCSDEHLRIKMYGTQSEYEEMKYRQLWNNAQVMYALNGEKISPKNPQEAR